MKETVASLGVIEQEKLKAAFYLLADVLVDAPEVLAGMRLNKTTGIVEAFDPEVNSWAACSNNISRNCFAVSSTPTD